MRVSLPTLLLLLAIAVGFTAWFLDRQDPPDPLYLHIYSCRYDYLSADPSAAPDGWQCMASLAFTPNRTLHFHAPMFYSPTVTVDGRVEISGDDSVKVDLEIEANACDLACIWSHQKIEKVGDLISCDDPSSGMEDFKFSVSRSKIPPAVPAD